MKRHTHTLWILYLFLGLMGVSPAFGQTLFTTAIHYDTSYDDSSPKTTGHEITIPLGIAYKGEYFPLSLDTAYSSASVEIDHTIEANLASFTDTLLSATYTYTFPTRPLNLILGVDVNLPTGKKRLSTQQELAEWGENSEQKPFV